MEVVLFKTRSSDLNPHSHRNPLSSPLCNMNRYAYWSTLLGSLYGQGYLTVVGVMTNCQLQFSLSHYKFTNLISCLWKILFQKYSKSVAIIQRELIFYSTQTIFILILIRILYLTKENFTNHLVVIHFRQCSQVVRALDL